MFKIAVRDIKILFRDKANMFLMMLFPLILVFLLGNLLANLDNADAEIEPIKMYYKVETDDPFSLAAVETFLTALDENDDVDLVEATDIDKAKDEINDGDAATLVQFTGPLDVHIYEGLDGIQNRAVNAMMNSFLSASSSIKTLSETAPEKISNLQQIEDTVKVREKDFVYNRTMLDYYAVAMIVMILFMGGGIGGATTIYDSRKNGTLARMLASPKSRVSLYIQTVLGSCPMFAIQVITIMIPSVLVFGAKFADNIIDNIILFITFLILGVSINSLFTLVGQFCKTNPSMIIMPVLWIIMFISGTFSKEIYIEGVTELSPIWLIQNACFDLTVFGDPGQCYIVMAVSIAVLILSTILGAVSFNRKEAAI